MGSSAGKERGPQDDKSFLLATKLAGDRLRLKRMMLAPGRPQVPPRRIDGDDQSDLLHPQPALDSPFALDGIANVLEALKISQAIELVLRGEPGASPGFMLPYPANDLFVTPICKRNKFEGCACSLLEEWQISRVRVSDERTSIPTGKRCHPERRSLPRRTCVLACTVGTAGECIGPSPRKVRGTQDDKPRRGSKRQAGS